MVHTRKLIIYFVAVVLGATLLIQIDPIYPMLNKCNTSSYSGGLTPDKLLDKKYILPLDILIVNTENRKVEYTEPDIQTIILGANKVWNQANVTFTIRSIESKDVEDQILGNLSSLDDNGLEEFAGSVLGSKAEDGMIDVIFVKSFANGRNGRALHGGSMAVAFLPQLDNIDQISLGVAHELGHIVGLCDVFEINLMMKTETNLRMALRDVYQPSNLTYQQVAVVQYTIEAKYQ
jgi:hypothetical protein